VIKLFHQWLRILNSLNKQGAQLKKVVILSNICFAVSGSSYIGGKQKTILHDISFELAPNSITGLIGESGCGKTTLAKIIAGIIPPVSGTITVSEKTNIQLLFQNSEELIHPYRKVINILKDIAKDTDEINTICSTMGIEARLLEQKGISLSGGERQRAGLARILLNKPDLILLDEPFSAQDTGSQEQLINLFREINEKYNSSLLIISHNIGPIKNLAEKVLVMHKGKIVEAGTTSEIINNPLHPYTRFLLKAESYSLKREEICNSEVSETAACSFYNNCSRKTADCIKFVKLNVFEKRNVLCNNYIEEND
jgi:ABC-type dipeptide/oligopeptide/nickel transport system ATPase subunit